MVDWIDGEPAIVSLLDVNLVNLPASYCEKYQKSALNIIKSFGTILILILGVEHISTISILGSMAILI